MHDCRDFDPEIPVRKDLSRRVADFGPEVSSETFEMEGNRFDWETGADLPDLARGVGMHSPQPDDKP